MKLWKLTTFLTVLILTFNGCVGSNPKPTDTPTVDATLPVVSLTQNGVFADMKAIGFEWKGIKDTRVQGIYVYKKTVNEENLDYKYHDTIKSRFVTHYVDENLEPKTQYGYYFKTFSSDAESNPSDERFVNTLPYLDSVSWIHAVQNMPRSAKIIWRPHTNQIVKAYRIDRKSAEDEEWEKLTVVNGRLSAEYIDTELKDNYIYSYRIRVLTYNDITSYSSKIVKVITKPLPKVVTGVFASEKEPKKIKIIWKKTEQSDFSNYNIYRSSSEDGSYDLLASVENNEYIDKIDEDNKIYFYKVSVVDKDTLESKFNDSIAKGQTLAKPKAPFSVITKKSGNNIEVSWQSNDSRVKSYIVKKRIKKGWFSVTSELVSDIKSKLFVDRDVETDATYSYQIYAVDKFSIASEPSETINHIVPAIKNKEVAKQVVKKEEVVKTTNQTTEKIQAVEFTDIGGL